MPSSCCFLASFFHGPQAWSGLVNTDAPSRPPPNHPPPLPSSIPHPHPESKKTKNTPHTGSPPAQCQMKSGTEEREESKRVLVLCAALRSVTRGTVLHPKQCFHEVCEDPFVRQTQTLNSVLKHKPQNIAQTYWHL